MFIAFIYESFSCQLIISVLHDVLIPHVCVIEDHWSIVDVMPAPVQIARRGMISLAWGWRGVIALTSCYSLDFVHVSQVAVRVLLLAVYILIREVVDVALACVVESNSLTHTVVHVHLLILTSLRCLRKLSARHLVVHSTGILMAREELTELGRFLGLSHAWPLVSCSETPHAVLTVLREGSVRSSTRGASSAWLGAIHYFDVVHLSWHRESFFIEERHCWYLGLCFHLPVR